MPAQAPAAPTVASAFLPLPRIPNRVLHGLPDEGVLARVLPGTGAEEAANTIRAMHADALAAVLEVTSGRPGGTAWRAASDADAQAAEAGKPPKRWQLGDLVAGDPQRWAAASAACRTLTRRTAEARKALDLDALTTTARTRLDGLQADLETVLGDCWTAHRAGDRRAALDAWDTAEALADQARDTDRALEWLHPTGSQRGMLLLKGRAVGLWWACKVAVLGANPPALWPTTDFPPGFDPSAYRYRAGEADRLALAKAGR